MREDPWLACGLCRAGASPRRARGRLAAGGRAVPVRGDDCDVALAHPPRFRRATPVGGPAQCTRGGGAGGFPAGGRVWDDEVAAGAGDRREWGR
jgi:hypothetical protein